MLSNDFLEELPFLDMRVTLPDVISSRVSSKTTSTSRLLAVSYYASHISNICMQHSHILIPEPPVKMSFSSLEVRRTCLTCDFISFSHASNFLIYFFVSHDDFNLIPYFPTKLTIHNKQIFEICMSYYLGMKGRFHYQVEDSGVSVINWSAREADNPT